MQSEIALPRGYALNEYRIETTLGVGGFGLTYLATDDNLNLRVAIKEYLPGELAVRNDDHSVSVRSDDSREAFHWGRSRFLEESRTLASFRHPNIVRVMRFFEANSTAYMVMEFVDGTSLSDWIGLRRPPPESRVLAMAHALLDGLEVVHRGGYLHRDIKPANIYVRADESPVLLDFGSARSARGGGELTAIVTPGYAPLEQYHAAGNQGPWSDLYSLGAVLYWMVVGVKPPESVARVRSDPMLPAASAGDRGRYSAELLKAIDWALAPAEEQRPQSVRHLREALQRIRPLAGSQDPTVLADLPPQAQDASRPATQATSTTLASFDRDAVRRIEAALAAHLGPIAGVTLRAAAKKALSLAHLVELAAREIESAEERTEFLKRIGNPERSAHPTTGSRPVTASRPVEPTRHTGMAPPTSMPVAPASVPVRSAPVPSAPTGNSRLTQRVAIEPEHLALAEIALAKQIGAIAKVVVRRAAAKARDATELFLLVSDEIEDAEERKQFLRRMMARIGK